MKIFLSELMLKYKIVRTADTPEPDEWTTMLKGFTNSTTKPLMVGFEKRL